MARILSSLLAVLTCMLLPSGALAQKRPPFIVILVPGLKAEDLTRPELQPLHTLVWRGAWGWMNSRTARVTDSSFIGPDGRPFIEAACVTINAGSRAAALPAPGGFSGTFAELVEVNSNLDHPVPIGALGDMLNSAGLKTAVIGRADDASVQDFGRLIAMDSTGSVNYSMPEPLTRDVEAPFGIRTNVGVFSKPPDADLQVWVFGDLWRAEQYRPLCTPEMNAKHRADALSRLGQMLDLITPVSQKTEPAFLLLSPQPASSAPPLDRLAPVLRFGYGIREPGRLYSPSTRTEGLVTNTDVLPTIAAHFGLTPPPGSIGRAIVTRAAGHEERTAAAWAAQHALWLDRSRKQAALGGLPLAQFVLCLGAIGALLAFRARPGDRLRRVGLAGGIAILTLPLAQLVLPILGIAKVLPNAVLLAGVVIGMSVAAAVAPHSAVRIAAGLGAALVGILLADLLTGRNLLRNAWMSYSVMEGGRYYGIGNEYSGASLGATCALALLMGQRFPAKWVAPALGLAGALMGLPALGADAGALAACIIAAAAAFAVSSRGRKGLLLFIAGAAAGVILIALIALSDAGGAAQSHIGRAASAGGIGGIIYRKAALNTYLLFHSKWTLCLIAAGVGLWLLRRSHDSQERITLAANAALLTGATAMLVLNDSGVVAAANTVLYWLAGKLVLGMSPLATSEHRNGCDRDL